MSSVKELAIPLDESYQMRASLTLREERQQDKLFVFLHGFSGPEKLKQVSRQLGDHVGEDHRPGKHLLDEGSILFLEYPKSLQFPYSNLDPYELSLEVSKVIAAVSQKYEYKKITIVGHSAGSTLLRKAYLWAFSETKVAHMGEDRDPSEEPTQDEKNWAEKVDRIVLIAGLNRGFEPEGHLKSRRFGTGPLRFFMVKGGVTLGAILGRGKFTRAFERHQDFVANLRIEWARYFGMPEGRSNKVIVVQVLGDIDNFIDMHDSMDLLPLPNFYWMRARASDHLSLLDTDATDPFGTYRERKLHNAIFADESTLQAENEKLPKAVDLNVKHVVFMIHGIRSLGKWSASFEEKLRRRHSDKYKSAVDKKKLIIRSPSYYHFGALPFLNPLARRQRTRWLKDEIIEAEIHYPAATFDIIGHSNGSFLLAEALENYRSLKMNKILFCGSVVRCDYDWDSVKKFQQASHVRNYVASEDVIVAFLPRFFELYPMRLLSDLFRNKIGGAGFFGFDELKSSYMQSQYGSTSSNADVMEAPFILERKIQIPGGHSAFLEAGDTEDEAVDFMMGASDRANRRNVEIKWWLKREVNRFLCPFAWGAGLGTVAYASALLVQHDHLPEAYFLWAAIVFMLYTF